MASVELLLSRLRNVRTTGPNSWRANCPNPVHARARGSLAITFTDDGRVLMVCFACHDTLAILGAVGLELADLFPERIRDPSPEGRRAAREAFKRSAWAAALGVLARESTVVLIAQRWLRDGKVLTTEDDTRLIVAGQRIEDARVVLA